MPEERFYVEKRAAESRYVLLDREAEPGADVIGEESYRDATFDGASQRIMYHTEVSEKYGGFGLAGLLVRTAVDDTVSEGLAVVPVCPYVVKWLGKNTEHAEHVVKATPAHLEALKNS